MNAADLQEMLELLRESGTDNYRIEAKAAQYELPENIDSTLSAFGNMPEGGIILLGIAENGGSFDVTGVWDANKAQSALGNKARQVIYPPLQLGAVEAITIEGKQVVTCIVPPQPADFKPFRVGEYGHSFTRSADGDYQLSRQEEQFLEETAHRQVHDRSPVPEADVTRDLDPDLVSQYIERQTKASPRLAAASKEEQLLRTNVVANDAGEPTVAAVYALGIHPQQFFPHLAIKAHVKPRKSAVNGLRLIDQQQFGGPVPDLLDRSLEWVQKHLMSAVVFEDGHGRDLPELPAVAIRELIANALVHRDLSAASTGTYSQIVKEPTKLTIVNPGGLWGITESQLGFTGPHARNPVLYDMCAAIRASDNKRVIEGHATGIPAVRQALREAFLPEPFFKDSVVSFTSILTSSSLLSNEQLEWLAHLPGAGTLSVAQKHALVTMRGGQEVTNASYRAAFPMDSVKARSELQELVEFGLAGVRGSGRGTAYVLNEKKTENKSIQQPIPLPSLPDTTGTKPDVKDPHRRYISKEDKMAKVRQAIQASGSALSKEELIISTGLTQGQLSPTITHMLETEELHTTKSPLRARNQRYFLGPKDSEA